MIPPWDTFDRADWHSGDLRYPRDLPPEAAGTHIGMFLAWAILRRRISARASSPPTPALGGPPPGDDRSRLPVRGMRRQLRAQDLNEEGAAFARVYFQDGRGNIRRDGYLADYERVLGGELADLYRVADTWPNFDLLAKVIDLRFDQWQRRHGPFS
jgi:hypothetical protein